MRWTRFVNRTAARAHRSFFFRKERADGLGSPPALSVTLPIINAVGLGFRCDHLPAPEHSATYRREANEEQRKR